MVELANDAEEGAVRGEGRMSSVADATVRASRKERRYHQEEQRMAGKDAMGRGGWRRCLQNGADELETKTGGDRDYYNGVQCDVLCDTCMWIQTDKRYKRER
eukprot:GHVS01062227.1.p3 GENE.GHVS01062227.1~~GHVS01062227.1.p3  ORF type:complete len:102 (-),score=25.27 GHVS01062227.1:107-412(-)